MNPKAVCIVSGGMDSATLAYHYKSGGYDLTMVSFDYGQRHVRELRSAAMLAEQLEADHRIIDLKVLTPHLRGSSLTDPDVEVPDGHYAEESMKATVVPNRNAIMISIAAAIAVVEEAEVLATGVHAGDHFIYPDCRPEFIDSMRRAIRTGNEGFGNPNLHLEAPFADMGKHDIAAQGAVLGVPFILTWSCYKGGDVHCGTCGTCVERKEAFKLSNVPDPTEYAGALPE